jgi:hypothetical protein
MTGFPRFPVRHQDTFREARLYRASFSCEPRTKGGACYESISRTGWPRLVSGSQFATVASGTVDNALELHPRLGCNCWPSRLHPRVVSRVGDEGALETGRSPNTIVPRYHSSIHLSSTPSSTQASKTAVIGVTLSALTRTAILYFLVESMG